MAGGEAGEDQPWKHEPECHRQAFSGYSRGQGLADIGKRNSEPPPIKLDGWKDKVMVGLVLPLGAPFGIVVFGVVWMAIRRSKKRKFVESVQS